MDRINAAFTYLLQGCHCAPAVGHPGGEVGGSRRFIVFVCFCHKFWNCDLVRHNVAFCKCKKKKEDARSVIPLWRRWGFGPEKFTAAAGMSLKVRGGTKASCSCHSRISQRSHRPLLATRWWGFRSAPPGVQPTTRLPFNFRGWRSNCVRKRCL